MGFLGCRCISVVEHSPCIVQGVGFDSEGAYTCTHTHTGIDSLDNMKLLSLKIKFIWKGKNTNFYV